MNNRTLALLLTLGLLGIALGSCTEPAAPAEPASEPGSPSNQSDGVTSQSISFGDFWIDPYEVSNRQYRACVAAGACAEPLDTAYYDDPAFAEHPVIFVTRDMAQAFCAWRQARLPSLAEWQLAAGDRSEKAVTLEGDYSPVCRLGGFSGAEYETGAPWGAPETSPISSGSPNQNGLYGLDGTIWEWVQETPSGAEAATPVKQYVSFVRISRFSGYGPLYQRYYCSFRCAGSP